MEKQVAGKKFRLNNRVINFLICAFIVLFMFSVGFIGFNKLAVIKKNDNLRAVAEQYLASEKFDAYLDGHPVVGVIEIEKLGLMYPIITYDRAGALLKSICHYNGPKPNEYGNTVLCSNRKQSGLFFSDIGKLKINDTVILYGSGTEGITYKLLDSFIVPADSDQILPRAFTGEVRELTIFTASSDNKQRYVYKFVEQDFGLNS
jgi:Sortase (surface protein transpeptidase)